MTSVTAFEEDLINNYLVTSANVLYLSETIFTLSQEINVIWSRKWTAISWLYAFTRYLAVADCIVHLLPDNGLERCGVIVYMDNTLLLLQFLCFAFFSSLRVYALMHGRRGQRIIAGLVLLLNLVPFGTNLFSCITSVVVANSELCTWLPKGSASFGVFLSLITRISVIIGDALVLGVTWMKTAQLYHEAQRLNTEAPLVTMLFRDGTIYFIVLLVINVLQVFGANVPVLFNLNVVQSYFLVLPPIIICRFILNLRQIRPTGSSWTSGNESTSIRFVGNMGQSLQFGGGEEDEDGLYEHSAQDGILPDVMAATETLIEDNSVDDNVFDTRQNAAYHEA